MQIRFLREAEIELAEARLWYSLQGEGLDFALMNRVDKALGAIAAAPYSYPVFVIGNCPLCGRRTKTI